MNKQRLEELLVEIGSSPLLTLEEEVLFLYS